MTRLLWILTTLSLTSCAFFQKKENYDEIMQDYLRPTEGRNEELSSKQIKKVLMKEDSMAGGNYQIKLFPITDRMVKAYYKELAFKNGFNEREKERLWKELSEEYLNDKTCLHFEYEVVKFKKVKDLKSWNLEFLDFNKQNYPITWKDKPLFSMPAMTKIRRSGNLVEQWLYEGTGCTDTIIPLEKEFGVKITPAYVQWPFPSSKEFWWEFDRKENNYGKEEVIKKKKRSFQNYRGW